MSPFPITTKRVYAPPATSDGFRLLVMRRWPRGIPKAAVDAWEKDLGPSPDLLQQWRQGQLSWEVYTPAYLEQMAQRPDLLEWARGLARQGALTLLCSCKDAEHCHRTLLQGVLEEDPSLRP